MERRFVEKKDWIRIKKCKDKIIKEENEEFNGFFYCIFVEEVNKKFVASHGDYEKLILDDNYTWLQIVPLDKHYVTTVIFNEKKEIVQWYIDITNMNGVNLDNKLFYDDMYLDVIVDEDGSIILVDEDELNDALSNNLITSQQYKEAYKNARDIMDKLKEKGLNKLKKETYDILNKFNF